MTVTERHEAVREVPGFARTPVLVVAAVVAVALTAVSGNYGYFGDELYFVAAGHHLAWGYADQPPLLPLIALLMDTIAPGSVVALRVPATLAIVALIVIAALTARELGGGRRAQLVTAGAVAVAPNFLANGHWLATSTFDPLWWAALTFVLVRWSRTRSDRLLLAAGVITAVALQTKVLVVGFWAVALVVLLVVGPRALLGRPALWVGGAIAVGSAVPTIVWQAQNGWPQVEFSQVVASESVYAGGMLGFLPLGLLLGGLLIGTVLAVHGVGLLLRDPALRYLGITAVGVTVLFMVTGGRPYYIAGMFPLLWAASAAGIQRRRPAVWWRWVPTWPVYALTAVLLVVMNILPIRPVSDFADQPLVIGNFQLDEVGWPETVADVVAAHDALPPGERERAVVVTSSYWTVAAMQMYAPQLPSYSPSRGAAWFATPPEDSGAVVFVGDPKRLAGAFTQVEQVGVLDNDQRINNMNQGRPIFLLEGRTRPWVDIWAEIRHL
ncbi:ArnT family glycosyltransferase [Pseudonocardia sp. TRM90224]|uniref:ArnT family glycosyltransferase n=1 Tax=Pseudonocardia sp. TRM90224 TaxID=2812678 RepID=UPI001E52E4C2|nr:glycosyltransferase family 39 protein [Pseudonocardia sp. TRM90224]